MPHFDLTTESWIPVRLRDGTAQERSLRSTLIDAHHIQEIFADSPLQTVALYRLLQALTLRIDGLVPADEDDWRRRYEHGSFDASAINAYFDTWQDERGCFDLFHEERPFYQHPEPMTKQVKSVTNLFAGRASGNNAALFDHAMDEDIQPVSPAEAARGLVATQATALAGGKSKPFYYRNAPYVSGAIFWIRGRSLFEALFLNSPPSPSARMDEGSTPAWERAWHAGPVPEAEERPEKGYLDYLTWPSRRILLQPKATEDGDIVVRKMKISQGDSRSDGERDPLMAFKHSEKTGIYPLNLDRDKALWRDSDVVMQVFSDSGSARQGGAPRTIEWVTNRLPESRWWVDVFGIVNDQAKIERWEHSRMPVYRSIVKHSHLQHDLSDALSRAERQGGTLRRAIRECAAHLLHEDAGYDDLGKQARADARDLAESLGALQRYWASLEEPFFRWLDTLSDASQDTELLVAEWTRTLYRHAQDAYEGATRSIGDSAHHHRARAAGQDHLYPAEAFQDILTAAGE
jgi:CRISPR system Cascade subunit CasA